MSKSRSQRANDTYWMQLRGKQTALTFLYHSLQDIHVVFLSHSTKRRELRLGDELQELKQREKKLLERNTTQTCHILHIYRTQRQSIRGKDVLTGVSTFRKVSH